MNLTEKKLAEFIKNCADSKTKIKKNTSLFSTSLLDSVCLLDIVMFVEETENIKIDDADINLKNFDTIAKIISCIKDKSPTEEPDAEN